MDVAFVTNVVYPFVTGGAQKRVHEIGTRLADRGHDVTIYGRHYWDGPAEMAHEGMTLRAVADAADLYEEEGRRSITEAIDFSVRLLPPFARQVDDHDVVVASVFPYFPVLSSRLATLLRDVPLVTVWHEVWGADYWDDYLGRLALGGKVVERLTAAVPQHPIAVSGVTADKLARMGMGPRRADIEVVPNGIDVDQIRSAPLPDTSHRRDGEPGFDVLFAGRLIADKRVDVLLDAFDRVAEAHDATLGIVGEGPELDHLRERAAGLSNADRVTLLGFLDEYEDVLGQMRAARVFASASTREGFGISCAEAMAADCTVVAADHPDSAASEVVGDGGFLVDPTVEAFARALDDALSGARPPTPPTTRAERFDWDAVATRAEERYRRAVDGEVDDPDVETGATN
ncbi:glycosyltransferase family 4 protein [Candidatus Halobonum tyrrellensis]|uniref:Glycosyltransferase n=1 Tax=Candidatus Halobonum tyrrellensis G22 TaxID=1324957 RepID=V4HQ08_9EURY|nr:glycosyltransferase family 4 protein [Candidatus Halobonum tyrrellensis]ESP89999.1 glycosyltransferase [Candidatus Halobonum tyrrellensis G22]